MAVEFRCPSCESASLDVFYELVSVPVHSVLLLQTRNEALEYPTGDIVLGFCEGCGFVSNIAFDPGLQEYSSAYESTQGHSPTYNAFAHRLATDLTERYDLYDKEIIEIGCGQGEFLALLCELGDNRGVGFDPAYRSEHRVTHVDDRLTFVKDFYSEAYSEHDADFVCCKMTLEHIHDTANFVRTVRRSIGDRFDTVVFFQVPNATRILRELAFWDIYYEHCSYFSAGALARLFRRCGFDVMALSCEYDEQYLMIEAQPGTGEGKNVLNLEEDPAQLRRDVVYFSENYKRALDTWRNRLQEIAQSGRRAVIWGAGSKGVAFLTTLDVRDEIEYAVDINPHKHGMYMAGTGQEIVSPQFLQTYRPDLVIVMNSIYCAEIQRSLDRLDVDTQLVAV